MGNVPQLTDRLCELAQNSEKRKRFGVAAYHTITEEWNAEMAVDRLLRLTEAIRADQDYSNLFSTGPCSVAPLYTNEWINKERRS